MKYGFPANALKDWYGESPKPVGPIGRICQIEFPVSQRRSIKSIAFCPSVPMPYFPGRENTGSNIPAFFIYFFSFAFFATVFFAAVVISVAFFVTVFFAVSDTSAAFFAALVTSAAFFVTTLFASVVTSAAFFVTVFFAAAVTSVAFWARFSVTTGFSAVFFSVFFGFVSVFDFALTDFLGSALTVFGASLFGAAGFFLISVFLQLLALLPLRSSVSSAFPPALHTASADSR